VPAAVGLRLRGAGPGVTTLRSVKHYTAETIDWLAVYDVTSQRCYYVPARELGDGMSSLTLRLAPTRNGQHQGIRFATDYLGFQP
jgi:hypothetical protein